MEFIKFPKIPRLNRNMIITEKIDGTNAQIYIHPVKAFTNMQEDYEAKGWKVFGIDKFLFGVVPASRNRLLTLKKDNFGFAKWVNENARELIRLGPGRHFGEWWGKGIQRGYDLDERRFSLFNVSVWNNDTKPDCCSVVPTITWGNFDTRVVESTIENLRKDGSYAALGYMKPEGIVVFHSAANQTFKVTCENDEVPKGLV